MKNRNLEHKDDRKTPEYFYKALDAMYKFDFDPCPYQHDMSWNWLEVERWQSNFINPPYSRKLKDAFVKKAIEESKKWKLCVLLLPVSTSTILFHDYIQPNAKDIKFVKTRINFIGINSKWQKVNFKETTDEIIKDKEWKNIPLHVKNNWMHDSMVIILK